MNGLEIRLEQPARWHSSRAAIARGTLFKGMQKLTGIQLLQAIEQQKDNLRSLLSNVSGFFALAVRSNNKLIAAVDSVRSIPLFFAVKQGILTISDNAASLDRTHGGAANSLAEEELLQTGYVTGHHTLAGGVFQIPAGNLLVAEQASTGVRWELIPYFELRHVPQERVGNDHFQSLLDEAVLSACQRLIEFADGRKIVIPLSGGYDSRLLATTLVRLGYDNLAAFTYGVPRNEEARVSQQVAAELGIEWLFANYTKAAWRASFHSTFLGNYLDFSNALASIPHIQDWLAIKQLTEQGMIPADSVLVPGHSGDLLAGSRSKALPELYQPGPADLETSVNAILKYHYHRWGWQNCSNGAREQIRAKVSQSLGDVTRFPDNASIFESWDMRERQAKYIVNSVRVYDYWEYDWWLPLWDSSFVQFWQCVPLSLRRGCQLYKSYVQRVYRETASTNPRMARCVAGNGLIGKVKNAFRHTPVYQPLKALYTAIRQRVGVDKHFLEMHAIVPDAHPYRRLKNAQGALAYLSSVVVESRRAG